MPLTSPGVPLSGVLKRFALVYLAIAAVITIVLVMAIRVDRDLQVERAKVFETSRVKAAAVRVRQDIRAPVTDLRVITRLPLLRNFLDSGSPADRDELARYFLVMATEMRRFDQIRYLDSSGQEIIRINYNNGRPVIVPRESLSNKSERYYFTDTISLDEDELFVSRMDLNVENGVVEIPYKATIRYSTPVFDSAGQKRGIVLLNYLGDILLQDFRDELQAGESPDGVLLNQDGYWLAGNSPEDEWGFVLGKSQRTFGHDYPEAWRTVSSSRQGSLLTGQGLFVYATVDALSGVERFPGGTGPEHAGGPNATGPYTADWKIVTFVPNAVLTGSSFHNQVFGRILLVVIYVLFAVGAYIVARVTLSRELARQEILRLNSELEQRVLEHAEGEEKLHVTLNSIGDAVMATDAEGRITRLNTIAERLTGWSLAEAKGHPVNDIFCIINQHTREPVPVPVATTLAHGITMELSNDTVLIARDGAERPIADSCAPIRNRAGTVIGAVLVFRDVSNEYAAKVALQDSATRIRAILDTVADGIITIDEYGVIETYNPAAERLFGYTAGEVLGRNVRMLMPEPYHSEHDGYLERYRSTGEAHLIGIGKEVKGRRKDGSVFQMELAVTEMSLDHQRSFIGLVRDITQRKQAEVLLHQAKEDAELANRAKDSFLATMSHEIRTPLTGMLGMLEMLSLTSLDSDQKETLRAAWDSSRSLLRIVSDILDWSKIEAGKLQLAPQPVALPRLLQEVANTYSRLASAKGLVLRQVVDARLGATHIVDGLRLTQVLNNFVSNAIKFTQSGEIELGAILLDRLDGSERIRFSVRDTGIGIAKDARQRLFRRFQQESVDTARRYGGTGLGLAICRSLVELMDGEISLESEPGEGSVFSITLTLPLSGLPAGELHSAHLEGDQRVVAPLYDGGEESPLVLAVDDNVINRNLLAHQLRLLGLRSETASTGAEALLMWRDRRFALVITDCHMPEMDGYALARTIRRSEDSQKSSRTPIIAWTANALAEEEELCHAAGMDDLLVKPVDLAVLKRTLARWLPEPGVGGN